MDEKAERLRELERSVPESKRSIVAKWAEIVGDDIRNKRGNDYKEYRYRVMHGLKEKFEDRPRDTDDGESRESDDEPYPIRDLYLKYRKDKKELKELRIPDLHRAAYRGDLGEAERLLPRLIEEGDDPKKEFHTRLVEKHIFPRSLHAVGTSPLAVAMWKGNLDVAKFLAKNTPHDDDYWDYEAFQFALATQDPERLRILVDNDLVKHFATEFRRFVSTAGYPGNTLYSPKPAEQRLEFLELLLKAGADVNEPSNDVPAILLVFDRLENPNNEKTRGLTDGDDLSMYNGMVKLLLAYGGADRSIFPTASSQRYGKPSTTILQKAVDWGFEEVVLLLLRAGADPNPPQQHDDPSANDVFQVFQPAIMPWTYWRQQQSNWRMTNVYDKWVERTEKCKMMVEDAKTNHPSLSLESRCWNFISTELYRVWKERCVHSSSKKRGADLEIHCLKVTRL